MTLEENKIYYNKYGGEWIVQFDRIDGSRLLCHHIVDYCDTRSIRHGPIFSSCYPHCVDNKYEWREAKPEEIAKLEKAVSESVNNIQSLYEIF